MSLQPQMPTLLGRKLGILSLFSPHTKPANASVQAAPDGCICVEVSLLVQRDPAAKAPDTGFEQQQQGEEAADLASLKQAGHKAQPQKLPPSVWRAMSGLAGGTTSQVHLS